MYYFFLLYVFLMFNIFSVLIKYEILIDNDKSIYIRNLVVGIEKKN